MAQDCLGCDTELEPTEFPYSDGVECPNCLLVNETDWDEDYDNMYWWVTQRQLEP